VRFEAVSRDSAALARLVEWKSRQYRASGLRDWLAESWLRELLDRALASDDPDFGATLSALWVGEELAAAQVALRSRSVWHLWYPAYGPRFARWSPGLLLDLEMAAAAGSLGLRRVDLGRVSPHKARLADTARPAASGEVPAAGA
jgi:CelD/BcsL family acetyltransferase involved in cellulose biosynthesis